MRKKQFVSLVIFGIAFGFLEAVVVVYLRRLFGFEAAFKFGDYRTLLNLGAIAFISPAAALISDSFLVGVERLREAATIVMLVAVSALAAKSLRQALGAFLVSFSLWDIFYYVFLKVLLDWPKNVFDPDVFFLLPYVWVGPVVTALVISTFLLIAGSYLYLREK